MTNSKEKAHWYNISPRNWCGLITSYNTKHTTLNSVQQKMSDDARIVLQHLQPMISNRSPLQYTFQVIWCPGSRTSHASTADRRSHGSSDLAHSPGILEHSGVLTRAFRTGWQASTSLPLQDDVEPRLAGCWGRTTVGCTISVTRTRRIRHCYPSQNRSTCWRYPADHTGMFTVHRSLHTDLLTDHARAWLSRLNGLQVPAI